MKDVCGRIGHLSGRFTIEPPNETPEKAEIYTMKTTTQEDGDKKVLELLRKAGRMGATMECHNIRKREVIDRG